MIRRRSEGIQLHLDRPIRGSAVTLGSNLPVSGWAFARDADIVAVEAELLPGVRHQLTHGRPRPSVAGTFRSDPTAATSGFVGRVPTLSLEPGSREVRVTATDTRGRTASLTREIRLERLPHDALAPDTPLQQREALIYIHIPKTAGTSVRELLESITKPNERIYIYRDSPGMPIEAFQLLPERVRASARLIMGHMPFGIHEYLPQPARYVTMLRDPVARVISLYHHHRRNPQSRLHTRVARMTLEEFAEDLHTGSRNQMTKLIAGRRRGPGRRRGLSIVDVALRNIDEHFSGVLLMEQMGESMARLSRLLGAELREPPRKNVSAKRQAPDEGDADVRRRIAELNELDMALYEEVTRRLERERAVAR